MNTLAFCPTSSLPTSASSTWATASIWDRSPTSRILVPGLFIMPVTTISPTLALIRVTTPSRGETMVV